jgi:hypothetical protein
MHALARGSCKAKVPRRPISHTFVLGAHDEGRQSAKGRPEAGLAERRLGPHESVEVAADQSLHNWMFR